MVWVVSSIVCGWNSVAYNWSSNLSWSCNLWNYNRGNWYGYWSEWSASGGSIEIFLEFDLCSSYISSVGEIRLSSSYISSISKIWLSGSYIRSISKVWLSGSNIGSVGKIGLGSSNINSVSKVECSSLNWC